MSQPGVSRSAPVGEIAIVGQGRMARAHARAWSNLGRGGDIAYVCTPGSPIPIADAPAARFVTDLEVVLADPRVEILSVCTPTPTHADIAISALAAGKHVLLEKPIALTLADAQAIREAATRSDGILMVAHVVRFFTGYEHLYARVSDGELGNVFSVRASRISAIGDPASWLRDESRSGGMLVDFAIHDFDQVNAYLGEPIMVTAVAGRDSVGDSDAILVETTIEYRGGSIGQVLSCQSMPEGTKFTSSIELFGSGGMAEYRMAERSPMEIVRDDPYTRQAAYFLHCVETRSAPEVCQVDDAITALAVSLAARESLASGTRVPVMRSQGPESS